MVIPGSAKGIVKSLMKDYHYSVREIAEKIKVTSKTLYQILNQNSNSMETDILLIFFYIRIRYSKNKSFSE